MPGDVRRDAEMSIGKRHSLGIVLRMYVKKPFFCMSKPTKTNRIRRQSEDEAKTRLRPCLVEVALDLGRKPLEQVVLMPSC